MTARHECREPGPGVGPIGWIIPGPPRQVTGGYLYDARIVDGLRARGRSVGVVDIRCTRLPLDPAAGRRLTGALGRQCWGAVVVDELAHPALAAAIVGGGLRRALAGAPLVLLVHHLRCSEPGPRPARALAQAVETAVVRAADLIVCTSETTARTVRSLARGDTPIEVVRPGWDTHEPRDMALTLNPSPAHGERGTSNEMQGVSPSPTGPKVGSPGDFPGGRGARGSEVDPRVLLRLLLVGHWTPRKGIHEALEAVGRVRPVVTLDLVGELDRDPAYMARVLTALNDPALTGRVRVHGRVSSDELARLYAQSDALLLPSTHEGYGMVLAEAVAAGLPIVATRVGAVPEVVRDGQEAELVPPGDVWALARAITRLAAVSAERHRRSELARERAGSLPRWTESIAAFDDILARLLARSPRSGH